MAVIPTGALYNTLTFGGVNSGTYGIYITGEGVYNSPERAVELTAVPGRNGAVPVDLGRWENIEVIYKASTGQDSQVDFRTAVADFRNAIGSLRGYQRLEDTYHPDEFRMGLFISGLDVEPTASGKAGEFELKFNCKPQRFLKSGEDPVTIADGGSITNPTSLNASPVIQLEGYGDMQIGDYTITLQNIPLGTVQVAPPNEWKNGTNIPYTLKIADNLLVAGDPIYLSGVQIGLTFGTNLAIDPTQATVYSNAGSFPLNVLLGYMVTPEGVYPSPSFTQFAPVQFQYGTARSTSRTIMLRFVVEGTTYALNITFNADYMPSSDPSEIVISYSFVGGSFTQPSNWAGSHDAVMGNSTLPQTGHPAYIDCEIGEAYKIESGEMISINGASFLGTELPVLKPGANAISYDNTVTSFKIVPRWWKL